MSAVDLGKEALTVLPARYETRRWGRGGRAGVNVAVLAQNNTSVQAMEGCVVGCVQNSVQINIAIILQQ